MKQLSCDQCRERWDNLLSKSTFNEDPQNAEIRAHLNSCADCRHVFDLLVAARQELHQFSLPKAPASLRANVLRQIEKPGTLNSPWWNALPVSRRLAWASGASVAIFLVALLMLPERQAQIMHSQQKVLSNRAQIEEHNNALSPTPAKPALHVPTKKVLREIPRTIAKSKSPQKIQSKKFGRSKSSELSQKPIAATPKQTSPNKDILPAVSAPPTPQPSKPQKSAEPQAEHLAAPPIISDSDSHKPSANDTARTTPSSPDNFTLQRSMNRSFAKEPRDLERSTGADSAFRPSKASPIIHWSKTITSDYDVTNAEITATLEAGLLFAHGSQNESERTLWSGTLFRGKHIPLNLELRRTSTESATLHLEMIDTDTRKVLLDTYFEVN